MDGCGRDGKVVELLLQKIFHLIFGAHSKLKFAFW